MKCSCQPTFQFCRCVEIAVNLFPLFFLRHWQVFQTFLSWFSSIACNTRLSDQTHWFFSLTCHQMATCNSGSCSTNAQSASVRCRSHHLPIQQLICLTALENSSSGTILHMVSCKPVCLQRQKCLMKVMLLTYAMMTLHCASLMNPTFTSPQVFHDQPNAT